MIPVTGPALHGTGTAADPWVQTTVYHAGSPAVLEIEQRVVYVDGRQRARVRYAVRNIGAAPVSFRASVAGNFFDVGADGYSLPLAGASPRLAGNQVPPSGMPGAEEQWGMGESTAWEEVASSP
jgi:hypothetical protein